MPYQLVFVALVSIAKYESQLCLYVFFVFFSQQALSVEVYLPALFIVGIEFYQINHYVGVCYSRI